MPQLNKEKLDQMVQAVMKVFYPAPTKEICDRKQYEDDVKSIRTALTPFAMEMTDEEIEKECDKQSALITDADEAIGWDNAFMMGANLVKYGK